MGTRRQFLAAGAGAVLAAGAGSNKKQAGGAPPGNVPKGRFRVPDGAQVPSRQLGRTGVRVSTVGLGGYHLGIPSEAEALRIIHTALDHGMNFLDNCWDYNDGESERRVGKALEGGYRKKAFVMTKLDGRTAQSTRDQLGQSLKRLRVETIDLVQIHEVIRPDDPERVFAPGGSIEELVAARKAGKIRFLGF